MKISQETVSWKDKKFICEYYDGKDFSSISPITQVQALCITHDGNFVIYRDREGHYGLPGGSVEPGESLEEALTRELFEEAAVVPKKIVPLLYLKFTHLPKDLGIVTYQVRYCVLVNILNQEVNDPAGKATERKIVDKAKMKKLLNWGKKVEIYLDELEKVQGEFLKCK
jgi:8-oxo-dGTP pyrophosphatase MutT (NUDIX family)